MSSNSLSLTPINGEPRVHDLLLAERLGFAEPRAIRKIIKRNEAKLLNFGTRSTVSRVTITGQPSEEFYLNQKQAIFVCMKSETDRAFDVQAEIVRVFDAYLTGGLKPAPAPKPRHLPRKHYRILQSEVDEVAKWTAQPGRAKAAVWEHLRKIGGVENVRYFPRTKMPEALAVLANLKKRTRAFVNDSKASERAFIDTILSGVKLLSAPRQPEFKLLEGAP